MAEIFPELPLTSLPAAVAAMGALPVPVGPQPQTARQKVDEAFGIEARLFQHALDKVFSVLTEGGFLAAPSQIAALRARIAELEVERHSTNEALSEAAEALRARQTPCPCPPADRPHQLGCPQAEVPPSERPVNGLTATFMPVASLREVPSGETDPGRRAAWRMLDREERHDSPLRHDYRVGHDLPELGGGA